MLNWISTTASQYLHFYQRYLAQHWAHMTPEKYGALLITISVVGYLMMKSGQKAI